MLKLVHINNISIISIILQCDYLNHVNMKIIQSQRYLKTIDSQVFFCKRNKEIQGSTMHVVMQLLKLFNKPFERTRPLKQQPSKYL